nr:cytochrome B [Achromobacter sp.]
AWYALVRRKRLVRAIITGKAYAKDVPPGTPPADNGAAVWLRALLLAAMVTGLVLWIRSLEIVADMSFS